ncbi:MAG TPA: peptidoglycan DD-metalloendopeptidase family protein [Miltoncostaeaceae bacterium]|nr:peptidoglycan DD-metalloendopeptidase family protein [Miltoncostaeaceae bacterium]
MTPTPTVPPRHTRRRNRRLALAAVAALAAAPVSVAVLGLGQTATERKDEVDRRLERVEERLQRARGREADLTRQVTSYSTRIGALRSRLIPLQGRLQGLESQAEQLEARRAQLDGALRLEKDRLARAEDALASHRRALADRLRYIYQHGEPDLLTVLLSSGSVADVVETQELLQRISDRDGALVEETRTTAREVRASRDRIQRARDEARDAEVRAETTAAELRAVTEELESRRADLDRLRQGRQQLLVQVQGDRRHIEAEAAGLRRRSAALAARIVAAQTSSPVAASVSRSPSSSGGMIWPAAGTFTSPFGPRWGRMHEGIDIAVPTGTPVSAAAAGRVISSGWSGGYGNLVVIDHGGGIATAYAHNSRLLVSPGQSVGQGTTIALAGSTGHSTGPHVHFEVRVNGAAVDPMRYL